MFASTDLTSKDKQTKEVLAALAATIGHSNWYISGSFANELYNYVGDVDVFFYRKEDQEKALEAFLATPNYHRSYHSANADTFRATPSSTSGRLSTSIASIRLPIQLISKVVGSPYEVFESFDLNVCKVALLSSGTYCCHPSFYDPITITQVNSGTFKRFFKYTYGQTGKHAIEAGKAIIDKYIGDSTLIENYYEEEKEDNSPIPKKPCNSLLFKEFRKHYEFKDYLRAQTKLHAPELLV